MVLDAHQANPLLCALVERAAVPIIIGAGVLASTDTRLAAVVDCAAPSVVAELWIEVGPCRRGDARLATATLCIWFDGAVGVAKIVDQAEADADRVLAGPPETVVDRTVESVITASGTERSLVSVGVTIGVTVTVTIGVTIGVTITVTVTVTIGVAITITVTIGIAITVTIGVGVAIGIAINERRRWREEEGAGSDSSASTEQSVEHYSSRTRHGRMIAGYGWCRLLRCACPSTSALPFSSPVPHLSTPSKRVSPLLRLSMSSKLLSRVQQVCLSKYLQPLSREIRLRHPM